LRAEIEAARRSRAPQAAEPAPPADPLDLGQVGLEDVAAEVRRLAEGAEEALKGVDDEIARHPRVAVLAALAIGLVVGSLLSR
jgi:hypothetical protein